MAYSYTTLQTPGIKSSSNRWAVSKAPQPAIGTAQTLDLLLASELTYPNFRHAETKTDRGRATGYEEPTRKWAYGYRFDASLNDPEVQPNFLAWLLTFMFGTATKSTVTSGVYDYKPTLLGSTVINLPYFTAAARTGSGNVGKEEFIGNVINGATFTFNQGSGYLGVQSNILGSGNRSEEPYSEIIVGTIQDTSITTTSAIYGASDAACSLSIHKILCDLDGLQESWKEVAWTKVEETTPASGNFDKITITAPGTGATACNYLVVYRTKTAEAGWAGTMDGLTVATADNAFRLSDVAIKINGKWEGWTTGYTNGTTLSCEWDSFSWNYNNNAFGKDCLSGSGDYFDVIRRGDRTQTVAFSREMIEWVMQEFGKNFRMSSLHLLATGNVISAGYYYEFELVFPRLKFDFPGRSNKSGFNLESVTGEPLAGGSYDTVLARVRCATDGIFAL